LYNGLFNENSHDIYSHSDGKNVTNEHFSEQYWQYTIDIASG
jgi:hypothetical protein